MKEFGLYPEGYKTLLKNFKKGCIMVIFAFFFRKSLMAGGWEKDYELSEIFTEEMMEVR